MKEDITPLKDGITHINVYTKGKTELGRMLSNLYNSPTTIVFQNDSLTFKSLEGYWYFLVYYFYSKEKDFSFCSYSGFEAKQQGQKIVKENKIETRLITTTEDFLNLFKESLKLKVKQNKKILTLLTYSELPFFHYYFYGTEENPKIIYKDEYNWILDIFDEIRIKMKAYLKKNNIVTL